MRKTVRRVYLFLCFIVFPYFSQHVFYYARKETNLSTEFITLHCSSLVWTVNHWPALVNALCASHSQRTKIRFSFSPTTLSFLYWLLVASLSVSTIPLCGLPFVIFTMHVWISDAKIVLVVFIRISNDRNDSIPCIQCTPRYDIANPHPAGGTRWRGERRTRFVFVAVARVEGNAQEGEPKYWSLERYRGARRMCPTMTNGWWRGGRAVAFS